MAGGVVGIDAQRFLAPPLRRYQLREVDGGSPRRLRLARDLGRLAIGGDRALDVAALLVDVGGVIVGARILVDQVGRLERLERPIHVTGVERPDAAVVHSHPAGAPRLLGPTIATRRHLDQPVERRVGGGIVAESDVRLAQQPERRRISRVHRERRPERLQRAFVPLELCGRVVELTRLLDQRGRLVGAVVPLERAGLSS